MKMSWRWYGINNDEITLDHIKQIPGITTIVWSLHDKVAGEEWEFERIKEVADYIHSKGFDCDVVESVNIHDDIKIGRKDTRDEYIDKYINTIRKLSKVGVKVICYNFMPVFDWTRTDLYKKLEDGSNALYYESKIIENTSPEEMVEAILKGAKGKTIPGWEPERLSKLKELFEKYKGVTEEKLLENFQYFMKRIIPVCEEEDVKMAIHPDDPPWSIFGLPRIVRDVEHIRKILAAVDSPYNGLTLCCGSLGSSLRNNIPTMIREFKDRIHFTHVRNVEVFQNGDFIETSHRNFSGNVNIVNVMKAFDEIDFKGYIRPDHGRHLWGEEKNCRPGYGLYDRALGAMYILGIWDTLKDRG